MPHHLYYPCIFDQLSDVGDITVIYYTLWLKHAHLPHSLLTRGTDRHNEVISITSLFRSVHVPLSAENEAGERGENNGRQYKSCEPTKTTL